MEKSEVMRKIRHISQQVRFAIIAIDIDTAQAFIGASIPLEAAKIALNAALDAQIELNKNSAHDTNNFAVQTNYVG